jgi:PAS domain S-box-containing protein
MNFRIKTTLLLSAVIILFLSASWWALNGIIERSLRETILKSADSLAQSSAITIANFLTDKHRKAKAVAVGLHPEHLEQNRVVQLESDLKQMLEIFPDFENGMFILKPDGELWVDYPPHPELRGQVFAHREYYQKTIKTDRGVIGDPYFSARTSAPVLTFTEILRDASGKLVGILGCSTQLNSPTSLGSIPRQKLGESGYVYVFNRSRRMILHPDQSRVLQYDVPKGANRLFDAAIEGFEGVGETINSRKIPMLLAIASVPQTDWIVGAQQPMAEALAPLKETQRLMLITLLLGSGVAVLIGVLWIRRITSPLELLSNSVNWIGLPENQIPQSLEYSNEQRMELMRVADSKDEVGSLATAFIKMDKRLKELVGTLTTVAREWQKTFDTVGDAIFLVDRDLVITRLNLSAANLLSLKFQEAIGKNLSSLLFGDNNSQQPVLDQVFSHSEQSFHTESAGLAFEGDYELTGTPITNDQGEITGAIYIVRNVTERKFLEKNLRENSKMNALGTMAGGIAHDFNNILSAIIGYAEVLRHKVGEDKKQLHCIQEIKKSGERGANLVRSLMTYSRQEIQQIARIDLNELLSGLKDMINRLTDEAVNVHWQLSAEPLLFEGQKGKLEQVIINLIVNARDAMPDGGDLYIETSGRRSEQAEAVLKIRDTGEGMPKEIAEKIFDPFFTTKPLGKGTGLGLSIVHGIIRAHNGNITVDSALGVGTTFTIRLAASFKGGQAVEGQQGDLMSVADAIQKKVHILLVDDDTSVMEVNKAILEEYGWQVSSTDAPEKALEMFAQPNNFNLLITDVIMPKMNGRVLAETLQKKHPDLKVLFVTGYSNDILQKKGMKMDDLVILEKPFSPVELHNMIHDIFS